MSSSSTILTGNQNATVGHLPDGDYGVSATAVLSGSKDVLTGGDENFTVVGITNNSTVTLGNGTDVVDLTGNGNIVTLGAVQTSAVSGSSSLVDQVILDGKNNSVSIYGAADITLAGSNNSMNFDDLIASANYGGFGGYGYSATQTSPTDNNPASLQVNVSLSGSGDHITQTFASSSFITDTPRLSIGGGTGSNYVQVQDSGTIALGGQQNTVIVGSGNYDITAGSGHDYITLQNQSGILGGGIFGTEDIHLAGQGNQITGAGHATVTGGTGSAVLNMVNGFGGSSYDIDLGGANNDITLGYGTATVDAGSTTDTVSLTGITGAVTLHGSNDMLFVNDSSVTINDASSGLHVSIGDAHATLTIETFDKTGVIDFKSGVDGFTNVAQIVQNLHSDGAGGTMLMAAGSTSSSVVHFVGDTHLTAANFAIG